MEKSRPIAGLLSARAKALGLLLALAQSRTDYDADDDGLPNAAEQQ